MPYLSPGCGGEWVFTLTSALFFLSYTLIIAIVRARVCVWGGGGGGGGGRNSRRQTRTIKADEKYTCMPYIEHEKLFAQKSCFQ